MYADAGSYEEVREIFDVIDLIMQHGTDRAMEEGSQAGAADFANGKAAIFVQGTWAAGTILETNPDFQLGCVRSLPINNDEKLHARQPFHLYDAGGSSFQQGMDLALEFANYVLDDNDSSALFQSCTFNPIATCHTYEAASWVSDASAYVAAGRAYQDLVLPSAVTDEQGKTASGVLCGLHHR
jgi:raffinose/stachyose/melibiose transport system substrate-binding protein